MPHHPVRSDWHQGFGRFSVPLTTPNPVLARSWITFPDIYLLLGGSALAATPGAVGAGATGGGAAGAGATGGLDVLAALAGVACAAVPVPLLDGLAVGVVGALVVTCPAGLAERPSGGCLRASTDLSPVGDCRCPRS
jgi:hypothetical protein